MLPILVGNIDWCCCQSVRTIFDSGGLPASVDIIDLSDLQSCVYAAVFYRLLCLPTRSKLLVLLPHALGTGLLEYLSTLLLCPVVFGFEHRFPHQIFPGG